MNKRASNQVRRRVDPDFMGYTRVCLVIVSRDYSDAERSSMDRIAAQHLDAFHQLRLEFSFIEAPSAMQSSWNDMCFRSDRPHDFDETLVGVVSRDNVGPLLTLHKGRHIRQDIDRPNESTGEGAVRRFIRAALAHIEHLERF